MSLRNPVTYQRVARRLHERGVPVVPAVITFAIRLVFSCYCPHRARIGPGVSLGYRGLGVVISDGAVIGSGVEIGQGVTIGGSPTESGLPVVEPRCYIGSGAKVLGPITVGEGAVVAANAVVVADVPAGALVGGVPARVLKEDFDADRFLWHRIRASDSSD